MNNVSQAAQIINNGGVVAFPTETVYGLGADATNDLAVQQIYTLKGRPSFNPLIIHVANLDTALQYGIFNQSAMTLAHRFWPGPLTLVVPLRQQGIISKHVTAGLNTIAIRCPSHPVTLELLRLCHHPVAAPSANRSGYVSPTKYEHVKDEFGDGVFILPGDQSSVGLESTIIDCCADTICMLRPGTITQHDIEACLGVTVSEKTTVEVINAPGQLKSHYAPKHPMRLNVHEVQMSEALLCFGECKLHANHMLNLSPDGNLDEAAANLFDYMRALDKVASVKGIAVTPIPNIGIGVAINERLARAAARD